MHTCLLPKNRLGSVTVHTIYFFVVENMTIISKAYKYVYIYISIYMYTHIYIYVYVTASWSGFGSCLCMLEILFLIECSMCWDG